VLVDLIVKTLRYCYADYLLFFLLEALQLVYIWVFRNQVVYDRDSESGYWPISFVFSLCYFWLHSWNLFWWLHFITIILFIPTWLETKGYNTIQCTDEERSVADRGEPCYRYSQCSRNIEAVWDSSCDLGTHADAESRYMPTAADSVTWSLHTRNDEASSWLSPSWCGM